MEDKERLEALEARVEKIELVVAKTLQLVKIRMKLFRN